MSLLTALTAVQASSISHAVAKSNHLVIAVFQIVHVFGFIFLLAPSLLLALRLLGFVLPDQPIPGMLRASRRLVGLGLAMALTSGALLFLTGPLHYYENWAFDTKMVLLLAALLVQAAVFRVLGSRSGIPLTVARIGVSLSIVAWLAVSIAARAIAFV
jgi:hypothetical protein